MNIPTAGSTVNGPSGENTLILQDFLGGGAFGIVFKAVDLTNGGECAVKFPQLGMLGDEVSLTALFNEVQVAFEIEHPNVVRVLYVETKSHNFPPYIVMEYLNNGTLKTCLDHLRNAGQLVDIEKLQNWTMALVDGISAINAKLLHRDLKPDNILMEDDNPKISDFGLSKIIGALTRTNTFKGRQHLRYMAPEGWKLETNDIQLDMYSMGIIFYEIASLRYPYQLPSDNREESFRDMHLYDHIIPLADIRKDLPIRFHHIITRLLEKRPQDRFENWYLVKEALEKSWNEKAKSQKITSTLITEMEKLHEVSQLKSNNEARQQVENEERRKLDLHQQEKLLNTLEEAISEFNELNELKNIEVIKVKGGSQSHKFSNPLSIVVPYSGQLTLEFFWIEPELELSVGKCGFAAHLVDKDRAGLNYLLCRNDPADLYGKWIVCCSTRNALADPRKWPPRPEPFGFDKAHIREIQVADKAMHVFNISYDEELKDALLKSILNLLQRQQGK